MIDDELCGGDGPRMYIDQKPVVFSKTNNPANGVIRVKFSNVTLSLSLVEASWLAANIQREIRKVEQENPELCLPTGVQLQDLNCGDVVLVRDDQGNEAEYEVGSKPWQLGHGAWVVKLKGISGVYSLDRVVKIVRLAEAAK